MDKKPVVKQKSLFERIAVPVVIAVGIPAVIFIKLLEPSFVSYNRCGATVGCPIKMWVGALQ